MKNFELHARVSVLSAGGWQETSAGTIVSAPEPVETLKGPEFYYWVLFDVPQRAVDGDDAYYKAQILSCYLEHA